MRRLNTLPPVSFNQQQRVEELRTQMMHHVKKMQATQDSIIYSSRSIIDSARTRLCSTFPDLIDSEIIPTITSIYLFGLTFLMGSIDGLFLDKVDTCKNPFFSYSPSKRAAEMFSPPSDICVDYSFSKIVARIYADSTPGFKTILCINVGILALIAAVLAKRTYDWAKNEYMIRINCHPVTDPATFIAGDTQLLAHFAALPAELQLHIIDYLNPLSVLAMDHALEETLLQPEERQALDRRIIIQFVTRFREIKNQDLSETKTQELRTLYDQAWQLLNRESIYRDQPQLILRFLRFLNKEIRTSPPALLSKIDIKSLGTVFDKLLLLSTIDPIFDDASDPPPLSLAYRVIFKTFPKAQAKQAYFELRHYKTFLRQYIEALRSGGEIKDIAQYKDPVMGRLTSRSDLISYLNGFFQVELHSEDKEHDKGKEKEL